jgi:alkylated DNA repair dioxygenase AlkB
MSDSSIRQLNIFGADDSVERLSFPKGFRYRQEFISIEEERDLIKEIKKLSLKPYIFQEYEAKRRVKSYQGEEAIPPFLRRIRRKVAFFAKIRSLDIKHILVTEYTIGTPIGWHKDSKEYGVIIGLSLLSSCNFRFRKQKGKKWERVSLTPEPRSIYLMSGRARDEWEHSIPPTEHLRYSITFRTLRK